MDLYAEYRIRVKVPPEHHDELYEKFEDEGDLDDMVRDAAAQLSVKLQRKLKEKGLTFETQIDVVDF